MRSCIALLMISISFVSCWDLPMFSETKEIEGDLWDVSNSIEFSWEIDEISNNYDAYVDIRHTENYRYTNLYLFLDFTFPNGKSKRDTLECILATQRGKWLGSGLGDSFDKRTVFQENIQFPLKGEYSLKITHGMRDELLEGVSEVGLRIENPNE